MYPQDEISENLKSIETTLVDIAISRDDTPKVCGLLTSISLDIQRIAVLFNHAEKLKKIKNLREEKKAVLRFIETIEHWARYKDWGELCDTIVDVGDDLLSQVSKLNSIVSKKVKPDKKYRNIVVPTGSELVSASDEKAYRDKVNKTLNLKNLRESFDTIQKEMQQIDYLHEFVNNNKKDDVVDYTEDKLPSILANIHTEDRKPKRKLWMF